MTHFWATAFGTLAMSVSDAMGVAQGYWYVPERGGHNVECDAAINLGRRDGGRTLRVGYSPV